MNTYPPFEMIPVAVRAWADHPRKKYRKESEPYKPFWILVIDTETTADPSQSFKFGSAKIVRIAHKRSGAYRFLPEPEIEKEVLFYADDLGARDPAGFDILSRYCEEKHLTLISQEEFNANYLIGQGMPDVNAEDYWRKRYPKMLPVWFNESFDISRLAYSYGTSTKWRGAFTFYMKPTGANYNLSIRIKHIDSKKHLTNTPSLDLRTLVWSMTNKSHSLASACRTFQLPEEYCKGHTEEHGNITPEYIDYNRQDVTATAHLAQVVLRQYNDHPIGLSAHNAKSPASIAKSYLDAMGIVPILDRTNVPTDPVLLGYATSAFYGGRAECRIRNTPVPVNVLDYLSMYLTVNVLLKLWNFITAESITTEDATADVREFLRTLDLGTVLDRNTWPGMIVIAEVAPDGDMVPVRAAYDAGQGNLTNVGDNYLSSQDSFWYALPDLVAAKIRTGRTPKILRAIRFVPHGKLPGLKPVKLAGTVLIDPAREDFFKRVIEQRANMKQRRGKHDDSCLCAECRTIEFLKTVGNSGAYGIYVEMLQETVSKDGTQQIFGPYDESWNYTGRSVETAQKYCYPPIGAVITAGARLMLAILETMVTGLGGSWVFCDTDSMAVVATPDGGLIECPGGAYDLDGNPAVKALSYRQVAEIRERINALNPYDGDASKAILKLEASECFAYVISAKRYALFRYNESGTPIVPEFIDGKSAYTEHGLGLYLNPTDIESADRSWIRQTWQYVVSKAHGIPTDMPAWAGNPALIRSAVTSPNLMRWFDDWNTGKRYAEQVKPFGFMLLCSEYNPFGETARRFIAPFSGNPADWTGKPWKDLHYAASPEYAMGQDFNVKTFRHVIREFITHPEVKSLGPDQMPCAALTAGLLSRRTVRPSMIKGIGKESNRLEDQIQHVAELNEVLTDYGSVIRQTPERVLLSNYDPQLISSTLNARAAEIREELAEGNTEIVRFKGEPVTVSTYHVETWLRGKTINASIEKRLAELSAKIIQSLTGIADTDIAWNGYSDGRHHTPRTLLAMWRDMGYPSPRNDGAALEYAITDTPEVKPTRLCECGCGRPLNRSDQKYYGKPCAEKMRRRRVKARDAA
jgi:hypothetical protein